VGLVVVPLPHDLVDDELRVTAEVKLLDPELDGNAQAIDDGVILHNVVGHVEVQSNNIKESIPIWGDQNNATPSPVETERAVKVHTPVLLGHRGRGLLCLSPFYHEVHQSLGVDGHLWDLGYVKLHVLESPLGNPCRVKAVFDDFPKTM
jgi:hypothetical protein